MTAISVERWISRAVLLQDCVEAAERTIVTELDAFDVERNGVQLARLLQDLVGRHEDELRVLVDESPDQPRACDPVNLRDVRE